MALRRGEYGFYATFGAPVKEEPKIEEKPKRQYRKKKEDPVVDPVEVDEVTTETGE